MTFATAVAWVQATGFWDPQNEGPEKVKAHPDNGTKFAATLTIRPAVIQTVFGGAFCWRTSAARGRF